MKQTSPSVKVGVIGIGNMGWHHARVLSLLKDADEATHNAVKALQIRAVYGNLSHSRAYPGRELASHVL